MPRGFDTTHDTTGCAGSVKTNDYDFVGRYLSQYHGKVIGARETAAVSAAGLGLVLIYEDDPTASDDFSLGCGRTDATRAAQRASIIRAPAGTVLYFAVDYDAAADHSNGPIIPYCNGIAHALKSVAAANGTGYAAGVYGSGATCSTITKAPGEPSVAGWRSRQAGAATTRTVAVRSAKGYLR